MYSNIKYSNINYYDHFWHNLKKKILKVCNIKLSLKIHFKMIYYVIGSVKWTVSYGNQILSKMDRKKANKNTNTLFECSYNNLTNL